MYIDPGTGGQLFAILAVAFTAISGTLLIFAGRIKMFFARLRRKPGDLTDSEIENEE